MDLSTIVTSLGRRYFTTKAATPRFCRSSAIVVLSMARPSTDVASTGKNDHT